MFENILTRTTVCDKFRTYEGEMYMKKIFKILIAYVIGLILVFSLAWRADDINNKVSSSNQNSYAYNN